MALIRWNPSSDLMNIHSEMDRLFGDLTEGMRAQGNGGRGEASAILPVDIERTDDALVIYASVPGFSPDEVDVTVDNGVLTIDARHHRRVNRSRGSATSFARNATRAGCTGRSPLARASRAKMHGRHSITAFSP
jgi:HSP20 family protein